MVDKIMELMRLAMELNEKTDDDYFVDYSGHVKWVKCYYIVGGFDPSHERVDVICFDYEDDDIAKLDEAIAKLKQKLEDLPKQYKVEYYFKGFASVEVDAMSVDEALIKASKVDANVGDLEIVDVELSYLTGSDGSYEQYL